MARTLEDDELMKPGEVALALRVSPPTVARWRRLGILRAAATGGRHPRYWRSDVDALAGVSPPLPEDVPTQTRMDEDLPEALRRPR